MKFKLGLSFMVLMFCGLANFAQSDLQIKKKTSRKMPNMPTIGLTPAMEKQLREMNNTTSTLYLKGSNTRTDMIMKMPSKIGTMESQTFSIVEQCAQQRTITFNTKDKKYYQYQYGTGGQSSPGAVSARSGGSVTVTGNVTDTGERAKIFGYEARRLKQTITFTPSANACLKDNMQIDIDGWYADLPEFSCPMKISAPDNAGEADCIDKYDYQVKGAVTGVALKEVKKISIDGQVFTTMEEEATEVNKTTLADSFFAPPSGYVAANTLINSPVNSAKTAGATPTATYSNSSDSLSLPSAGLEKQPLTEKKTGVIRVGIAKPKVTTPESKKDPDAGTDIGIAVTRSLLDTLKAENVETIELISDSPESECREKGCDYIFYANVTHKRGGSGMFKSMVMMGAVTAAGMMVPGVGGIIASTAGSVIMGQTMGKASKAKDEFALDYKVVDLNNAVLSQGNSKNKTKEDGEDVLTPQIQQASKTVLAEIAKKGK